MTRIEAEKIIKAFVKLRELATDDMSLQVPEIYPTWREGIAYTTNTRILYNEVLYKVLLDHTSQADWTPEVAPSLFAKVLTSETEILEWVQPDSTNPYMIGDKVLFEGIVYESLIDYNIHSPAAYPAGWKVVE